MLLKALDTKLIMHQELKEYLERSINGREGLKGVQTVNLRTCWHLERVSAACEKIIRSAMLSAMV
jgi:hypothetical protein